MYRVRTTVRFPAMSAMLFFYLRLIPIFMGGLCDGGGGGDGVCVLGGGGLS